MRNAEVPRLPVRGNPGSSIQRKLSLAMIKTTGSVLLLALVVVFANRVVAFRQQKLADLETLAATLGQTSTAALSFNDPRAAQETLAVLQTQPTVISAALYSRTGDLFAAYRRAGRPTAPDDPALAHAARTPGVLRRGPGLAVVGRGVLAARLRERRAGRRDPHPG